MPRPADARNRFTQGLFTPLPGRYDQLAEVLSMGQNGRWRRAMVDRIAGPMGPAGPWCWTWRPGRPGWPGSWPRGPGPG